MINLKEQRLAAGLTVAEASASLGISRSTLHRYENTEVRRPDFYILKRMDALYSKAAKSFRIRQSKANGTPAA